MSDEYYGSDNEELFHFGPFATRGECVEEMLASGCHFPLWTAKLVPYRPKASAHWVLDHIGEDDDLHPELGEKLYSEVQEAGNKAWEDFGRRLNAMLLDWLDAHTSLPFKVADVVRHDAGEKTT